MARENKIAIGKRYGDVNIAPVLEGDSKRKIFPSLDVKVEESGKISPEASSKKLSIFARLSYDSI